jgi:hypothetical protein
VGELLLPEFPEKMAYHCLQMHLLAAMLKIGWLYEMCAVQIHVENE